MFQKICVSLSLSKVPKTSWLKKYTFLAMVRPPHQHLYENKHFNP